MSNKLSQFNPAIASKRRERDIMKLLMSDYKVTQNKDINGDFIIQFPGPKDSLYADGIWSIHVVLPEQYPYKSPSVGFLNKIWHPNIDEQSGSVCLDVINQTWSPMFDLINVFDVFLPQLLSYPNPSDPLNPEAAGMMKNDEKKYEQRVRDYVKKYALSDIKKDISLNRKESKTLSESKKESYEENDVIDDEKVSDISMSDVSELSQHSSLELDQELIGQY